MTVFYDNPLNDGLAHYGDGLFETLLGYNGRLINFDYHFTRLQSGCKRLSIVCPEKEKLLMRLEAKIAEVESKYVSIKFILSRGEVQRGYKTRVETDSFAYITVAPFSLPAPHARKLIVCKTKLSCQPLLAGLKHCNRLEQVMAKRELLDVADYDDGIMLDTSGNVIEGVSSNVFFFDQTGWHTPELSMSGVAGTMRAQILDSASEQGIKIQVGKYAMDDLFSAKMIILTNAIFGVLPVNKVEERTFKFDNNAVYALCKHVEHPCLAFYSSSL